MISQRTVRVARGNLARLGKTLGTLARVEAADLAARIQGTVPRGHYMEDLHEFLEVLPGTSPRDFDAALQVLGINPQHVLAQFHDRIEGGIEGEVLVIEVSDNRIACGLLTLREEIPMADLAKALTSPPATGSITPEHKPPTASPLRAPTMPATGPVAWRRTAPPVSVRKAPTRQALRADNPGNHSSVIVPPPSKARTPKK